MGDEALVETNVCDAADVGEAVVKMVAEAADVRLEVVVVAVEVWAVADEDACGVSEEWFCMKSRRLKQMFLGVVRLCSG